MREGSPRGARATHQTTAARSVRCSAFSEPATSTFGPRRTLCQRRARFGGMSSLRRRVTGMSVESEAHIFNVLFQFAAAGDQRRPCDGDTPRFTTILPGARRLSQPRPNPPASGAGNQSRSSASGANESLNAHRNGGAPATYNTLCGFSS